MKTIVKTLMLMLMIAGCNSKTNKERPLHEEALAMNINTKEKVMIETNAFLEITIKVEESNRASAAKVYSKYKNPFLNSIKGAVSKQLLLRKDDVQVLHGFEKVEDAESYLTTVLFSKDIVSELGPLLAADPEVRIYQVMK